MLMDELYKFCFDMYQYRYSKNFITYSTTQPAKVAWYNQLMLQLFDFITTKHRTCVRRTHIYFTRYLYILFARWRIMPSPSTVPIVP